ncbi:SulP family inorganic anion transporter [Chachezhania sediminis]|uniref:SulP family inorganic anion transporter n=1 Tax=Chachezhania sediminis TaxID=2599291 RepID=UPI00131A9D15|nr:sulfate permease [Chachezhania sediminis]
MAGARASGLARLLPILDWGPRYGRAELGGDLTAAVIVAVLLIPQSLAYALLAELPAYMGLYCGIFPLFLYAIFGTSPFLGIGPAALLSLMTASALGHLQLDTVTAQVTAAGVLALMTAGILLLMGVLRLGVLANFLSHPVVSGFVSASAIVIATSQLQHILGIHTEGHTLPELVASIAPKLRQVNAPSVVIGLGTILFLVLVRRYLAELLQSLGMGAVVATTLTRIAPIFAVAAGTFAAWHWNLADLGVQIVGKVPQGLPPIGIPHMQLSHLQALLGPAIMLALVGYVENISLAQTFAAKSGAKISPNQELIGLGSANLAAGIAGGYPLAGGFARTSVNFDAGARTPAAGAMTGAIILLAAMFLTPLLHYLPLAVLAGLIIVSILRLIDIQVLTRSWTYSRDDFLAVAATMVMTLIAGVELGLGSGIVLSIVLLALKFSHPHVAEIGQVPGTRLYRNRERQEVIIDPEILSLRVDSSLYFTNARWMEDMVMEHVHNRPGVKHVLLMFAGINDVDLSALDSLTVIDQRLQHMGVALHLTEMKGEVRDRLARSDFLTTLSGQVFATQDDAIQSLRASAG